jgi:hypothetical protein
LISAPREFEAAGGKPMPVIRLEILGETIEAVDAELATLANIIRPLASLTAVPDVTLSLPALIRDASLRELRRRIDERFDAEGYEVTISVRPAGQPSSAVVLPFRKTRAAPQRG